MSENSPLIILYNGVKMPALGLGVFETTPSETALAVETAIAAGYRLIDTAAAYHNERQVGTAIARSGVNRSELFVTTKLWVRDYGYDCTLRAFDASLRKLDLGYIDLYLLHWPVPSDFEATIASYRAAERLLADGLVRSIGVSNFTDKHLADLMARTDVLPAVNQVELHPFFIQEELRAIHQRLGIVTQSWSPIGGVYDRISRVTSDTKAGPLKHPAVLQLAAKHGKTPAQIVLRWHIDHGLSAIPKSVRAERIAENISLFDFHLAKEEIEEIDRLDTGVRAGPDPEMFNASTFRISIDEA